MSPCGHPMDVDGEVGHAGCHGGREPDGDAAHVAGHVLEGHDMLREVVVHLVVPAEERFQDVQHAVDVEEEVGAFQPFRWRGREGSAGGREPLGLRVLDVVRVAAPQAMRGVRQRFHAPAAPCSERSHVNNERASKPRPSPSSTALVRTQEGEMPAFSGLRLDVPHDLETTPGLAGVLVSIRDDGDDHGDRSILQFHVVEPE